MTNNFIEYKTPQGYIIRISQNKVMKLLDTLDLGGGIRQDTPKIMTGIKEYAMAIGAMIIPAMIVSNKVRQYETGTDDWRIYFDCDIKQTTDLLDWDIIENEISKK